MMKWSKYNIDYLPNDFENWVGKTDHFWRLIE